jgi:catechol 2,3-dioxygenase-like lactoylglutathione lyase family enzyme
MITNVSLVTVWVKDLDESLAFYTDVLGFKPNADVSFGNDYRWLTVVHPEQPELELHLSTPGAPLSDELVGAIERAMDQGQMPGIGLAVSDCRATYDDLSAKGVEFLQPPSERPYGVEALMRDNSGNWLVLVERNDVSAEEMSGTILE